MKKLLLTIICIISLNSIKAQVSLTGAGIPVTENFDALGSVAAASLPSGWKITAPGTGVPAYNAAGNFTATLQQASSGSPTAGSRYNWGSSATDRAIGFMTSGSYANPNSMMVAYQNNNINPLTGLVISFAIERYRVNSAAASVQFYYSTDGTVWTSVSAGDVSTAELPAGTNTYTFTNGTTVLKSVSISALSLAPGSTVYLRWNFNTTGTNSQGIGLDDVSVTPAFTAAVPSPTITSNLTANAVYGINAPVYTITASNNPGSYNATNLPPGLSIDTNTGQISGTPTTVAGSPFTVSISATNADGTGTANLLYTINPKTLSITGLTANTKAYDGTTAATLSGTALLTGIVGTDNVTLTGMPTASFADEGVGNNKAVTVTGYSLGGTDASNYILQQPTGLTASITAEPVKTTVFISQYYEGASVNKWIELTNPGTTAVNTSSPQLKLALYNISGDTGNINISGSPSQTLNLNITIPPQSSVLIGNTGNGNEVPYLTAASAAQTSNAVINFNGNDGIALLDAANNILDAFGQGVNAKDVSYVRNIDAAGPSAVFNAAHWQRTPLLTIQNAADLDDPDRLGVHVQPDLPECVSPVSQPTALNFTEVGTTSIAMAYTAAAGTGEYLIVRSLSSSLGAAPVDGTLYNTGDALGNGMVAGKTVNTGFVDNNLPGGTNFYYFIFSLNNTTCDGGPRYLSQNPLTGSQATVPLPLCMVPPVQPGNFQVSFSNYNLIQGTFTTVSGADEYLVIMSRDSILHANPVNQTTYTVGDSVAGGIVIKKGAAGTFNKAGLEQNTTYYFFVYAVNSNCSGGPLYLTAVPLTGRQKTGILNSNTLNFYFGNLHSHSSYSDGNKDDTSKKPEDDYAFAKNSRKMDFLGISEHNHTQAGMRLANWQPGMQAAKNATVPDFVALYGMEWGVISGGGHVIVYGIDSLIGWEPGEHQIYVPKSVYTGSTGLFNIINRHGFNAIATLAHPNTADYNNISATYDVNADNAIVGTALASGPAFSTNVTYSDPPSSMSYLSYYNRMLARGYHLGASIDHDNHNLTFGRHTRARLVVLAPALTETDLLEGIKKMRFYASEDSAAKITYTINGQPVGSIFTGNGAPKIEVSTATTNPVSSIKIIAGIPGSGIIASPVASSATGTLTVTDSTLANLATGYYYADILETDGSRIITSPIWYTRDDSFKLAQTITFDALPAKTAGDPDFTPVAASSSGLPLSFGSSNPAVASIIANKIHITGAGTTSITAFQNGNDKYKAATPVVQTLLVTDLPVPAIQVNGPLAFCPGGSVTLRTAGANSYQWLLNGQPLAGNTADSVVATATGNYSVAHTYANDYQKVSAAVLVTVQDTVPPVVRTRNISIALVNGTASISVADINDGSYDNCGIKTLTLDKTMFDCADAGQNTVKLSVTDALGNVSSAMATVTVTGAMPKVNIVLSRTDNTYTGLPANMLALGYGAQGITLTASNGPQDAVYQWAPAAGLSSTSAASTVFKPTAAGKYTFTLNISNSGGCTTSSMVTIQVIDVRCGNKNDKVLVCKKDKGKKADELCISANAVDAHLKKGATLGTCGNTYTEQAVTEHMDSGLNAVSLTAYPNPAGTHTTVNFSLPSKERSVVLQIFDLKGKMISQLYDGATEANKLYSYTIDVSRFNGSVFTIRLVSPDKVYTFKLLK